MKAEPPRDIAQIFRQGTLIDDALTKAAQEAQREHERLGLPAAAWRDGKVVWLSAEEWQARPTRPTSG